MSSQANAAKKATADLLKIPFWKQKMDHAGGFADIVKASFQARLMSHLRVGNSFGNAPGWTFVDLFAGRGLYELSRSTARDRAVSTRMWNEGQHCNTLPSIFPSSASICVA